MRNKRKDQYLHYVPEFDCLVVCEKKYKSFWRDAFRNGAKGKTPKVFIAKGDFGFTTLGE